MVRFHRCWLAQLPGMLLLLPVITVGLQAQDTPTDPAATAGNSALTAETPATKITIYLSGTNSETVRKTNDFARYVASRTEISVADWTPTFDRNKPLITLVCYSEPDPKRIVALVNGIRNLSVPDVGLLFRLEADSKPSDQLIVETPALLDQAELKPLWDYLKDQPDFEILAPAGNVIQAATKVKVFSFSVGIAGQTSSELCQQYDTLEERAKVLSQELREPLPDPETGDKLKSELRSTVQQAFETRQKLQRAELAEFAQRLKGIQQSIEMRDRISQQIIDRRVEQLLDPNLKWDAPDANSGTAQALRSTTADDSPNETPDGLRRTANQPSVPTQGVLGKTPQEFNDLFAKETGICKSEEARLANWEAARDEGKGGELADREIQSIQEGLREHKRKIAFAVDEYLEQIQLLEAVLQRDRARLAQADEAMQQIEALRKESLSTVTGVRERELQQQEARVALQRSESLLKLYRQAGEGFVPSSDVEMSINDSATNTRENR